MARPARLDGVEIRHVGCRHEDAGATPGWTVALLLRLGDRYRRHGAARSRCSSIGGSVKFKRKVGHFQRSEAPAQPIEINQQPNGVPFSGATPDCHFFPKIGTLFDRPHCVGTQDASAGVKLHKSLSTLRQSVSTLEAAMMELVALRLQVAKAEHQLEGSQFSCAGVSSAHAQVRVLPAHQRQSRAVRSRVVPRNQV